MQLKSVLLLMSYCSDNGDAVSPKFIENLSIPLRIDSEIRYKATTELKENGFLKSSSQSLRITEKGKVYLESIDVPELLNEITTERSRAVVEYLSTRWRMMQGTI